MTVGSLPCAEEDGICRMTEQDGHLTRFPAAASPTAKRLLQLHVIAIGIARDSAHEQGSRAQTRAVRATPPNAGRGAGGYFFPAKYSFEPFGSGFMVLAPGVQFIGQTSPVFLTVWKAEITRSTSSTFRPTLLLCTTS